MPAVLALVSAALIGTSDFLGGLASRHGRVVAVVLWAHMVGIVTIIPVAAVIGGDALVADLRWGALAGASGGLGLFALYRGFARAPVGVVAPVSAIGAATLPALFGFISGERPGPVAIAGILLGITAVGLVSRSPQRPGEPSRSVEGLVHGSFAAAGFGGMFIFLSRVSDASGILAIIPARAAGAAVILAVAIAGRSPLVPLRRSWPAVFGAGSIAIAGNSLFLVAVQQGLLSVVAVLNSLYPVATVLWARAVFKERLEGLQMAGVAMAIAALAMIVLG